MRRSREYRRRSRVRSIRSVEDGLDLLEEMLPLIRKIGPLSRKIEKLAKTAQKDGVDLRAGSSNFWKNLTTLDQLSYSLKKDVEELIQDNS